MLTHKLKILGELALEKGLSVGFWEDGLMDPVVPFDKSLVFPNDVEVYAFTWQTVWTWGAGDRAARLANKGYKVNTNMIIIRADEVNSDVGHAAHTDQKILNLMIVHVTVICTAVNCQITVN